MISSILSRREVLRKIGGGFGALGLASLFTDAGFLSAAAAPASKNLLAPRPPHFTPRAKRVIFLFMNGGPSHVDTFDPKPMLAQQAGKPLPESMLKSTGRNGQGKLLASPFKASPRGKSGIEVTEIYPEIGACIDDLCVL